MEKIKEKENECIITDPKYIEHYLSNAKHYLQKCDIQAAIDQIREAEDQIFGGLTYQNKESPEANDYDLFTNEEIYKTLISDEKLIFKCSNHYKAISKREPDKTDNGIDCWYNFEDNLQTITVCGRTIMKASILKIAAVLKEFEVLSQNIKSFESVQVLKKFSPVRWYTHSKMKMTVIEDRDSINLAFGMLNKKEKMLMIFLRSINEDEYEDYPKADSKYTRIKMNFGYYFMKYIDENTTELFACFNTNPNVSTVPTFIINNLSKDFTYDLVNDFKNAAESKENNEKYREKINLDKEFYDLFKQQIGLKDDQLLL